MAAWTVWWAASAPLIAAQPAEPWDSVDRAAQPFLGKQAANLPFTFRLGGTSSRELLANWKETTEVKEIDARRTKVTMKFTDPATQFEARAEAVI